MKNAYFTLSLLFTCLLSFSQGAEYVLDFEGFDPLYNLPAGVTNVDAVGDATYVDSGTGTNITVTQSPNTVISDGSGGNELFMDFMGYLLLDIPDNPTSGFSLVTEARRTDNNSWWNGFITITGYDSNIGLYVINRLQLSKPSGDISGFKLDAPAVLPLDSGVDRHLVFSYDGNTGLFNLYIDGVYQATSSEDLLLQNYTNLKLYIGVKGEIDTSTGSYSDFIDANGLTRDPRLYVDNISYFNRTLSETESLALYNGNDPLTLSVDSKFKSIEKTSIFPNPVKDRLYFKSDRVHSVDVYNLMGSKVLSQKVNNGIDVSNLSQGLYLVKCKDNNNLDITTLKIAKKL